MSPDSPELQRDRSAEPDNDQDRAAVLKSEPWLVAYGDETTPVAELRRRAQKATANEVHRRSHAGEPKLLVRERDGERLTTAVGETELVATGTKVDGRQLGQKARR